MIARMVVINIILFVAAIVMVIVSPAIRITGKYDGRM